MRLPFSCLEPGLTSTCSPGVAHPGDAERLAVNGKHLIDRWPQNTFTGISQRGMGDLELEQGSLPLLNICGSPDGRGVWGGMDTCICLAEALCCAPEAIATRLIGSTPI